MALHSTPDVRAIVDAMLAAPKTLAGEAEWRQRFGETKIRWRKPCIIVGEVSQMELEIQAFPDDLDLKFTINLIYTKSIYRLDYARTDGHVNSLDRPAHLPPGPLIGPHVHEWADNRRFGTKSMLPANLLNANVLPSNINSFERAFRWFCGEANITVASFEMPELPERTRLL